MMSMQTCGGCMPTNKDSDQLFQLRELQAIMGKLADITDSIAYLFRPVYSLSLGYVLLRCLTILTVLKILSVWILVSGI